MFLTIFLFCKYDNIVDESDEINLDDISDTDPDEDDEFVYRCDKVDDLSDSDLLDDDDDQAEEVDEEYVEEKETLNSRLSMICCYF